MNTEWHLAHVLGRGPTHDQRMAWHEEHARVCGCRAMSDSLAEQVRAWQASQVPDGQGSPDPGRAGRE